MKLADLAWPDVAALDRETVVLVPTGSLEQHGPHLPLLTDTLLVTAVVEAVEARVPAECLVTPTVWLGASAHHLPFAGSLTATMEGYLQQLTAILEGLGQHGLDRFYVVNGHGGNTEPNGIALRQLKSTHPGWTLGHAGYFDFIPPEVLAQTLTGSLKAIAHACEAETSLMLAVRPDLVRMDLAQDDGLATDPPVPGMVWQFDELSQRGPIGFPTLATAAKGQRLFGAAVDGLTEAVHALRAGVVLRGLTAGA